jgi:hypothetical protein
MAIYPLSAKLVSRREGRSVVAAAAYRSAEHLHDQRIRQSIDYTHKASVEHTPDPRTGGGTGLGP